MKMNKGTFTVCSNDRLTSTGVWKMVLSSDKPLGEIRPGQFVNLALKGHYLRRPISICDWNESDSTITIVYRVVGAGTRDMSSYTAGTQIDMLTSLGNGFSLQGNSPVLVGGGVGLPPMLALCKTFLSRGIRPAVVGGFASAGDVILAEEFAALGIDLLVSTMDGSAGTKGTVIDVLRDLDYDYIFACGPRPMLKALSELDAPAQLSVEERMGCGYGVCMGCSCKTTAGMKRVCKDGPVFKKEELVW